MNSERRAFLAFLSAALALRSIPTNAQHATRLRTVGVLMGLANDEQNSSPRQGYRARPRKKGWIVGKNLRIEYRFAAGDAERMFSLSKELVALHPDVIIGHSTPVVAALLQATQTIPIVFVVVTDPVGSGFVTSLARPGGNVTGFTTLQPTITGKYLSILRELKSQLTPRRPHVQSGIFPRGAASYMSYVHEKLRRNSVSLRSLAEVHSPADIETIMADLGAAPGSGLIVMAGNFTTLHRALIIS